MASRIFVPAVIVAALASAVCLVGPSARAEEGALEKYIGRWDVRVKTRQPKKPDVTYIETYEWMLGRRFLRGTTEQKSDGTEDLFVLGYDAKVKGYPFWIFSSSGTYLSQAPGTWDARKRVMEWKNPPQWDISYSGRCVFPDDDTRRCTLIMKDWRGKVLLDQEATAVRRDR